MSARAAWLSACALWIALILLGLAWELRLAPLKPGGSWLVLKVLPLLVPLRGLLHARRKSFQGATLLVWLYASEGALRTFSDPGPSARLAILEVAIALAFFGAAVLFLRATRAKPAAVSEGDRAI